MGTDERSALNRYSRNIGLAFQIRDDILDVQGETEVIGKNAGSDQKHDKATWPGIFGLDAADRKCRELSVAARHELERFGEAADPLRQLTSLIVERGH
jgi:geranylgeranyl pyrophosphate synthase